MQECSRLIEREVSTLAALVNEFSQFVRFPAAKLSPASANTIVHEAVEVFSGRLDGISLKTSLAENLPTVRADGGLLRSVIVNLIDNAAEALEGCSLREITVATRAHEDSETVEICVQDTGHGISPGGQETSFFLPQFSTKDRGTGLGLAIAARIIAEHGGNIHVEDNFPVGSRFVVELPVGEATPAAAERAGVETFHMSARPHLLVVDDEPGIRESLSSILQDEGYHVESGGVRGGGPGARSPAAKSK